MDPAGAARYTVAERRDALGRVPGPRAVRGEGEPRAFQRGDGPLTRRPGRSRITAMTDTIALARPVLLVALAALAATAVAAPAAKPGPVTVYVGTYTDGTSRGIYRFTFDPATGAMTEPVLAVETKNPSFLALHPSGRFLYAVGEISSFEGAKTGAVSAFAIDPKTGDLDAPQPAVVRGHGPLPPRRGQDRPQRPRRELRRRHGGRPADRGGRAPEARLVGARPRGLRPEQGPAGEAARPRDLPRRRRALRLLARPRGRPRLRLPLRRREGHARAARGGPARPRLGAAPPRVPPDREARST